jgi:hypothetical protein
MTQNARSFICNALLLVGVLFAVFMSASGGGALAQIQGVNSVSGAPLQLGASGNVFMYIGTDGTVGIGSATPGGFASPIGTTRPPGLLNVAPLGTTVTIGTTTANEALVDARVGTDEGLGIIGPWDLSTGVTLFSHNDAMNANVPLEIIASPVNITGNLIVPTYAVGIGTNAPYGAFEVRRGTDNGFAIMGPFDLASGVTLFTTNDAANANVPMEIIASKYYLRGGNVGIGMASPESLLELQGGGISVGYNSGGIGSPLQAPVGGIIAAGPVGIGTTVPVAMLDVMGFMRLAENSLAPAACSAANSGAIALTHVHTLCVCAGGSANWVMASDGITNCTW